MVFDVTIEPTYGSKVPATADFYLMFKDVGVNSEILLDDIGFHRVG